MAKVAITGMGRIGRAAFKIIMDRPELDLVAVNDLMPIDNLAYLLNYDTVYGRYKDRVEFTGEALKVAGKTIKYLSAKDPAQLPWKDLGIDIVFECTGLFTQSEGLGKHLAAGAKYAILSRPPRAAMSAASSTASPSPARPIAPSPAPPAPPTASPRW